MTYLPWVLQRTFSFVASNRFLFEFELFVEDLRVLSHMVSSIADSTWISNCMLLIEKHVIQKKD